jgi:HTH-type transcriptional repressor of NAD biosynthesis genes
MSGPAKPRTGFLLGKFMPPHAGHVFLCDFARHACEQLTILVCSLDDDPIPGELRWRWMQELFPDCEVLWCSEPLPQEPADHSDFWPIWREVVTRYAGHPDVVFASEAYGQRLAEEVGARFMPVDPERRAVPVSATAIRAAPFANWGFIPVPVRLWFLKRVCLFGPESTGKSTLAAALGRRFSTTVAWEYARTWAETYDAHIDAEVLECIALGHIAGRKAAERQAQCLLIEDTDPVLTAVWSDMLLETRAPWLDAYDDYADLYLLCDVDLPWEDDGMRYFPALADRQRFFERCRAELERRGLPYALVQGIDPAQREAAAARAILDAFPQLEPLAEQGPL